MDLLSWFASNEPVPAVAPADLRSIWTMRGANPSGQSTATDMHAFERICSPGADLQAVLYRVWMLQMLAGTMGMLLSPWLRNGELADAVFRVAATFPMKRMSVGVPQQELPFDVRGFLAEIERENDK